MKLSISLLKITSIIIGTLLVILFIISLAIQNKVGAIVLNTLNLNFDTKISSESYRLSLIKKFPKATIELRNVLVLSSHGFDLSAFEGLNTDTLLAARSASVDLRTIDMIRGNYTFTKITIRSGQLYLFTDSSGRTNYEFTERKSPGKEGSARLNLNRISLQDLNLEYNDKRVDLNIRGIVRDGMLKSRIRGNNIDFEGDMKMFIRLFRLDDFIIRPEITADLNVGLNQNEKGTFFKKSTMKIENWDFVLTGFVAADNYLDLTVKADNIDISRIPYLLPSKYSKALSAYHPEGTLKFSWITKGKSGSSQNPHYDIAFSLKDALIDNRKSRLNVRNLSFNGTYTNGSDNSPETSSFKISDFSSRFGSSDYIGSFSLTNFKDPFTELVFRGKLLPQELVDFLNMNKLAEAGGSIDLDLKFSGKPGKKDNFRFTDVFNMASDSRIVFNSVNLKLSNREIDIKNAAGTFRFDGSTITDNFRLSLNGQDISFSGKLTNLPGWLAGFPVTLNGTASVSASSFRPERFMDTDKDPGDRTENTKAPLTIPADVMLDIDFRVDTLSYKLFKARNINGNLSVRPGMLNFRSLSMDSQEGKVSGNGLVVQNPYKSFVGRGSFVVSGVDVKQSFTTFNNFGQDFIKAENLEGLLSGNITLVLPVDSLLNPNIHTMAAEGRFSISNGALVNFDPVKALSSFIELSELQNIRFDKLENDFFIRDNIFFLPQMEIRSSAADLSVNGEHTFDNKYEYHVKMLLSEILSKKSRKTRKPAENFGEIQDDGLGRTSIFLRIDGKGDNVKVSYDMKAAGNQLKENLKKEKETLKTIIKEEYGLYRKDSGQVNRKESRPRFRISWEGTETAEEQEEEPPAEKKEGFLDRLFKKK